jgi:hypothetical protein
LGELSGSEIFTEDREQAAARERSVGKAERSKRRGVDDGSVDQDGLLRT